ncbi:MAG: hypothetical protein KDB31_11940 [Microthrixaceae bacterium]|nr:hypothetical protein [Microthrixaceae bacterium]
MRTGAAGLVIGTTVVGGLAFTVAAAIYALWSPAWWLVVPMAVISTSVLVAYHYGFYSAERANDYSQLSHLTPEEIHESRLANQARAEQRGWLVLWTMAAMDMVALGATLYTVSTQSHGLGWAALFFWVVFTGLSAAKVTGYT